MALTQTKASGTGRQAQSFGPALVIAAVVVAALTVAMLATTWSARQGGGVISSQPDPLVQPAAIEFRAGEHAVSGLQDPLMQPGAIEFRAGEHAAGGLTLQQIWVLRGEGAGTGVQQVPQKPRPEDFKRVYLP